MLFYFVDLFSLIGENIHHFINKEKKYKYYKGYGNKEKEDKENKENNNNKIINEDSQVEDNKNTIPIIPKINEGMYFES
jgi:hypothetical protein